ncbi:SMI1/KNR4 family protein [Streptomyces sp. NPDC094448]|uniref:SMI1/KNR4 family protein n=1 Tax=Streptomyces sp. NPDC094448 TaxID=3366063 RepID=UPI003822F3E0
MIDDIPSSAPVYAFSTWEPVLRLLRAGRAARSGGPPVRVAGRIGRGSWSLDLVRPGPGPGGVARVEGVQDEMDAVDRVRGALEAVGAEEVSFCAEIAADGRTVLQLIGPSSAVESAAAGTGPGVLLLVEGAVPAPWRRLPESVPGAVAAPSADPGLLERTLRERLPDAVGATEAEPAAVEERIGTTLPAELKALYRVTRARPADGPASKIFRAVGRELLEPDRGAYRGPVVPPLVLGVRRAGRVGARPGDAVQGLVGSPGWIVFGDTGGGDRPAIDLTPGAGDTSARSSSFRTRRTSAPGSSPTPSRTWCRAGTARAARCGSPVPSRWPG